MKFIKIFIFALALAVVSWAEELPTPFVHSIFKSASVTANGSTALWTPTSGKKFRIMGYFIQITGQSIRAAAGTITIDLLDNSTTTGLTHSVYIPQTALNLFGSSNFGPVLLGTGYLSTAANNVLNVNLSAALTAGNCRVTVWGQEE